MVVDATPFSPGQAGVVFDGDDSHHAFACSSLSR
jgi:hypothetical protein